MHSHRQLLKLPLVHFIISYCVKHSTIMILFTFTLPYGQSTLYAMKSRQAAIVLKQIRHFLKLNIHNNRNQVWTHNEKLWSVWSTFTRAILK
jgi:hypothetical protein